MTGARRPEGVAFYSEGVRLAGDLYLPDGFAANYALAW